MKNATPAGDRFTLRWMLCWTVPAVLQAGLALGLPDFGVAGSAAGLFWLVVVAATGCAVVAAAVLARAYRRREAELGYIGLFFMAVSILPLVHGITTPGVLYGENAATMSSVQWSVPVALLLAWPLLIPVRHRDRGRRFLSPRFVIGWATIGLLGLTALSGGLLINTGLLPLLDARSPAAMVMGLLCMVGCVLLSRRHLYLAQVAGSPAPLVLSIGFGFVGASALVWFGAAPFSIGFWVAHGLDIGGVFAGTVGALLVLQSTSRVRQAIEPILATEPLAALELGLDPIVHRFVADLETYDSITRDHVVRTAELSVQVGAAFGLTGRDLRQLGLAALLHDIGKLELPAEIVKKPGRLTDAEYEVVKGHPKHGQNLVERSPALRDIGPFVRGHHERIDGRGYPDGLAGLDIPLAARIVAVCDAYDAMANSRQYREGMGCDRALAILREHAGTQWDSAVVAAAERVIANRRIEAGPALDAVGRGAPDGPCQDDPDHAEAAELAIGCDCLPTYARSGTAASD